MTDFRVIPSVEQLRQREAMQALEARYGRQAVIDALRDQADALRARLASGAIAAITLDDAIVAIETGAAAQLREAMRPSLVRVINATGVIIHTNLGRAPLSRQAAARVTDVATGYANLEYDLAEGQRGKRDVHAERLLARLTGAEAAVVVNNNAAATLLMLAALAAGREVIVSRGELVEIGGGFRVPDVMAQSGAVLREVGTTNRTRAADYAAAINDRTALILRVHPSNFRIEGFTERPALAELVAIGRRFKVLVAEDLGSGWLGGMRWSQSGEEHGSRSLRDEPVVAESLAAGADIVCFSGDKLLGGPQAGILAGRAAAMTSVRRHPLIRALRVDKLTYAALEATLEQHAIGEGAETVPVVRMLAMTAEDIAARASALGTQLAGAGWQTSLIDGMSTIGGGSAPGSQLPTRLLAIARAGVGADALEQRLRRLDRPVIARIEDGRLVLDLRTVLPEDEETLAASLRSLSFTAGEPSI